jgi:hypothetical protein
MGTGQDARRFNNYGVTVMSGKRASPLATAFLWATFMGAVTGVSGAILHDTADEIALSVESAAFAAAVVAYSVRKSALRP